MSIGIGGLEVLGEGGWSAWSWGVLGEERLLSVGGCGMGWEMDEKYFRSLFNYSILLSF